MSSSSQLPVIASTALVTHGSDARPVINRVAKSVVTASPHHHDFLVATLSRDRSYSRGSATLDSHDRQWTAMPQPMESPPQCVRHPGNDRRTATSVGRSSPWSFVSEPTSESSLRRISIRVAMSNRCFRMSRSRGSSRRACSLAASALPGASLSAGSRSAAITSSEVSRRMR